MKTRNLLDYTFIFEVLTILLLACAKLSLMFQHLTFTSLFLLATKCSFGISIIIIILALVSYLKNK